MRAPRKLRLQVVSPAFNIATKNPNIDILPQIRRWEDLHSHHPYNIEGGIDLLAVEVDFSGDPTEFISENTSPRNASGLLYALIIMAGSDPSQIEWELCGIGLHNYIKSAQFVKEFGGLLAISGASTSELTQAAIIQRMVREPARQLTARNTIIRLLPSWRRRFLNPSKVTAETTIQAKSILKRLEKETASEIVKKNGFQGISLNSIFADTLIKNHGSSPESIDIELHKEIKSYFKSILDIADFHLPEIIVETIRKKFPENNPSFHVKNGVNFHDFYAASYLLGGALVRVTAKREVSHKVLAVILYAYEYIKEHGQSPGLKVVSSGTGQSRPQDDTGNHITTLVKNSKEKLSIDTSDELQPHWTPSQLFKFILMKYNGENVSLYHPDYHLNYQEWIGPLLFCWDNHSVEKDLQQFI